MYLLQCSQGLDLFLVLQKIDTLILGFEQSYVDNSDPFTHQISDWTGKLWFQKA